MSHRVDIYLTLERLMLELDRRGDPTADAIRDVMDPIWYALSPAEHSFLDSRTIGEIHRLNPVTLSVEGLFVPVMEREAGGWEEIRAETVGRRFPLEEVLAV